MHCEQRHRKLHLTQSVHIYNEESMEKSVHDEKELCRNWQASCRVRSAG